MRAAILCNGNGLAWQCPSAQECSRAADDVIRGRSFSHICVMEGQTLWKGGRAIVPDRVLMRCKRWRMGGTGDGLSFLWNIGTGDGLSFQLVPPQGEISGRTDSSGSCPHAMKALEDGPSRARKPVTGNPLPVLSSLTTIWRETNWGFPCPEGLKAGIGCEALPSNGFSCSKRFVRVHKTSSHDDRSGSVANSCTGKWNDNPSPVPWERECRKLMCRKVER